MQENLFIQLIFAIIFWASIVIVSFSMFRVPIRENHRQITFLAVIVGGLNFYTKFIIQSPYALIYQIVVYIILLMILRRYPIFYSFIICITGSIVVAMVDAVTTITALRMNLSTMELMTYDTAHFVGMHSIVTCVIVLIAYALYRFNLGFSFVVRRFSGKHTLKPHNFIWAIILVVGFSFLQFSTQRFDKFSLHPYIIILFSIGLIASVIYAYFLNKSVLKDREGR